MKKLRLDLDELEVESFDTRGGAREKGTVVGEQCSCGGTCYPQATCPQTCAYTCDDPTCAYTCDDATCPASCNGTCAGHTCWETCGGTCYDTCRPRDCGV